MGRGGYWGSHMTMCMHVCGCALVRWVCAWVRVRLLCKRAVFFYALLISLFAAHCCRCCFFVTAFGPLLRFAFRFFTVLTSIYQVRTCVCVCEWVCFLLTAMHFDCWLFSYISFFFELRTWSVKCIKAAWALCEEGGACSHFGYGLLGLTFGSRLKGLTCCLCIK